MLNTKWSWWGGMAWVVLAVGCTAPLPTYPWRGADEAVKQLRERSATIRTFSGECDLAIGRPGAPSVRLQGAVAARMPSEVRLRAWKLQTPVVDMTARPDGVWLWVSDRVRSKVAVDEPQKSNGRGSVAMWTPGSAAWMSDPAAKVLDKGGRRFSIQYEPPGTNHVKLVATIERSTLTIRRYQLYEGGRLRHQLDLDDYRLFDAGVWPARWSFRSGDRLMEMRLRTFEFNESIPDGVFSPAKGAERVR